MPSGIVPSYDFDEDKKSKWKDLFLKEEVKIIKKKAPPMSFIKFSLAGLKDELAFKLMLNKFNKENAKSSCPVACGDEH